MLRFPIILVAAFLLATIAPRAGSAQTYTCPNSQTITVGTIVSGSTASLCVEDGSLEVLREGLSNGISKLRKTFVIPNVPPGTQYLNFWGTRPANSEGDNFQFYYNTNGKPFGILITGAIIDKPFAPSGGITVPLGITTTSTTTFYILMADTDNSGPILDTVNLDTLRIETR